MVQWFIISRVFGDFIDIGRFEKWANYGKLISFHARVSKSRVLWPTCRHDRNVGGKTLQEIQVKCKMHIVVPTSNGELFNN